MVLIPGNCVLRWEVGDRVEFSATLTDAAGSLSPQFKLKNIKCVDRVLDIMAISLLKEAPRCSQSL
jgi:hypothetical protein